MRVKEVMKKARTIAATSSVKQAALAMKKGGIGSLIAVNGGKAMGIITERDIVSNIAAEDKLSSKVQVGQIMSKPLITIDPEALIDDAVYLMIKHKIKKLPVLDDNKQLAGVITATDIVANSDEIGQFFFFD